MYFSDTIKNISNDILINKARAKQEKIIIEQRTNREEILKINKINKTININFDTNFRRENHINNID